VGPGADERGDAPLAEIMGRVTIASEACNCSAPDTGNMEVLTFFGTDEHKERWLRPLLDGEIRSGFAMTEPDVANSNATNIQSRIKRDRDEYALNGRKWGTSNAFRPNCRTLIVTGKTDPDGPRRRQQSMVLVPRDTPGSRSRATCSCSATATTQVHAATNNRGFRRAAPVHLKVWRSRWRSLSSASPDSTFTKPA